MASCCICKKAAHVGVVSYNGGMEKVLEEGDGGSSVGALQACFDIDGIQGPILRE